MAIAWVQAGVARLLGANMHKKGAMSKIRRAIGLMSGTSMDGIDVGLLQSDGHSRLRRVTGASYGYDGPFRALLRQAMRDASGLSDRMARPGCLGEAERELTKRHGDAVARFLDEQAITAGEIDVIGFHGQTVLHRPELGLTVQLGDGAALAGASGIDVVYDFRAADCASGGEGAPLVPVYHQALAARLPQRPLVFVNIGGIANITYVGLDGRLIAFDCGPGNALIDDWVARHAGQDQDTDGAIAAAGAVDRGALMTLMRHSYFSQAAPKSLDRNAFSPAPVAALSLADGAATLTAFTAKAIADGAAILPREPELWVICGGGRHNRTMMRMIAERVGNAVVPAEAVHLDGDFMEAEAFAFLAVRALEGLPLTYPETTGVAQPTCGGIFASASHRLPG